MKLPFTQLTVKSENDEQSIQSSHLQPNQTKKNREAKDLFSSSLKVVNRQTGRDDWCGPEPDRYVASDTYGHTETNDEAFNSPEVDVSDSEWNVSRETQSGFLSQKNSEVHVSGWRRNTAEKTFGCPECGKRCNRKSGLERHLRTHTGEKPFVCSLCGTGFSVSGSLRRHMRCHTGEKRFSCSVCKKRFSQSGHVAIHMRVHTGEKPYLCSICGRNFTQKISLTEHMRIHTGEKPYGCSVCSKSFTQKISLKEHMKTHSGEKHHCCSFCGDTFRLKTTLVRHMTVHTGENVLDVLVGKDTALCHAGILNP
ncbi:gastrula zinc finger protein XlCGF7.1-like [Thalassophryne amazonica]|uniref:gastrula zinc finger protein XlCGF7.1-like n=1 Tax=Thalassophryne amazonica TaxID=390379 RepID=UPI001470D9A7|nr:gastrula zinc finger protein XlCGF7.1-like [Thalassophryne amazonica]